MIKSKNGKEIVAVYDNQNKEIAEVRDNQGKLLFKNWNEIFGSLPLTFRSRAEYLKDYRIYGNTIQDGTPTPENPVEVVGCGERTENLFDVHNYYDYNVSRLEISHNQVTAVASYAFQSIRYSFDVTKNKKFFITFKSDNSTIRLEVRLYKNKSQNNDFGTITISRNTKYTLDISSYDADEMGIYISNGIFIGTFIVSELMMTFSPNNFDHYIPYGYKIPVTVSNGAKQITTPIYIGSEPLHKIGNYADYVDFKRGVVVRRIKKYIFNGKETGVGSSSKYIGSVYVLTSSIILRGVMRYSEIFCSHFVNAKNLDSYSIGKTVVDDNSISFWLSSDSSIRTILKLFTTEYASGTPVTVWYVLAEPEEEPLDLSAIQTIKGTNALTADTTVQPSEIYLKGKIQSLATHALTDSSGNLLIDANSNTLVTKEQ